MIPLDVDDEAGSGTRLAVDGVGVARSRRCARRTARPWRGSSECRRASPAPSTDARSTAESAGFDVTIVVVRFRSTATTTPPAIAPPTSAPMSADTSATPRYACAAPRSSRSAVPEDGRSGIAAEALAAELRTRAVAVGGEATTDLRAVPTGIRAIRGRAEVQAAGRADLDPWILPASDTGRQEFYPLRGSSLPRVSESSLKKA